MSQSDWAVIVSETDYGSMEVAVNRANPRVVWVTMLGPQGGRRASMALSGTNLDELIQRLRQARAALGNGITVR